MSTPLFVTPAWLHQQRDNKAIRIIDCRMLPAGYQGPRNSQTEYNEGHVPGAVFFDIEALSDQSTTLPHMLTPPEQFARDAGKLGISNHQHLVIYDDGTLFSAPRVWWMFTLAGVKQVSLLQGGLAGWQQAGWALESGAAEPVATEFEGYFAADRVYDLAAVQQVVARGGAQIIDARPAGRFIGQDAEPRPGLRRGHIPHSRNLPWGSLVRDGALLPVEELAQQVKQAGIDLHQPLVASCGSGVTAAVVVLALTALGAKDIALYDGSWSEWGGRDDLPIATGAAG